MLRLANRCLLYPWRRRNQPLAVERPWTAIDISSAPPAAAEWLATVARDLAACGFDAAAHFREGLTETATAQQQTYLSIWLNAAEAVVARAIWARFSEPSIRYSLTTFALSITTSFDDGSDVVTTNAPTVSTFPPDPANDVLGWHGMNHPAMLYKLHRARVGRLRPGRPAIMPPATPEGIEALMRETERRAVEHATRHGYLRRDADGRVRTTLRGSYLSTWRLLWPWRQLTTARHARKLRWTLAAFPGLAAEAATLPPSPPAMQERVG